MDKFFADHTNVPPLPKEQLDQMTELALSYRQHAPGNENARSGLFSGLFQRGWAMGAVGAAACIVLMIGVLSAQQSNLSSPELVGSSQIAQNDDSDAYAEITELAILDTLDAY